MLRRGAKISSALKSGYILTDCHKTVFIDM